MRHETPEGEYTFEPPTNPDDMYPVGYFTLPEGSVKVPTNADISTELRDYLTAFIGNNIVGALTPGMITMVPRKWGVVSFTNLDSSIVTNATLQIARCPYTKEGYFSLFDDLPYDGINDVSEIASMTLVPSNIFYTADIPLDVTIDGITKVFPVNSPITDLTDPLVSQLIAKGFSDDWDTVIVFTSELDGGGETGGGETGGSTRVFIIKNGKALVRNGKILSIN